MGLARKGIKWFQKENLPKIVELTEKWEPLCKKYTCTMTHLVIAWTAAQGNGKNVHVLVGARTLPQIEENVGGGNVALEAADIASMRRDVEGLTT
jgi:methylglyoxal reductase